MAAAALSLCHSNLISGSRKHDTLFPKSFLGVGHKILNQSVTAKTTRNISRRFTVFAVTEGSKKSKNKSEETLPTWARPDSDEPPPWAQGEGNGIGFQQQSFEVPFFVYLLASAVTAIAAIGSVFEYVNQKPVFGILNSDSVFYAPVLGFFAFTGIPTSAFLWFKSVQVANKEAEEQDKRDGYM